MRPRVARPGALLLVALALVGCVSPLGNEVRVHIENQTAGPVAVYVNGGWVGTYPAGATTSAPLGGHGGPPYTIVSEDPRGAVLTTTEVAGNDAASVAGGSTVIETSMRVDCGFVRVVIATRDAYDATSFTDVEACPSPSAR